MSILQFLHQNRMTSFGKFLLLEMWISFENSRINPQTETFIVSVFFAAVIHIYYDSKIKDEKGENAYVNN